MLKAYLKMFQPSAAKDAERPSSRKYMSSNACPAQSRQIDDEEMVDIMIVI